LRPFIEKWESEGRTTEQKWAVRNFLTGAGANGISHLIEQAKVEERTRIIGLVEGMPTELNSSGEEYVNRTNILSAIKEEV